MFMAQEDVCDTGLALSLGFSGRTPSTHHQHNIGSSASNPSLTLSLSEDASKPARLSSPHSTVSSFSTVYPLSIKREKDMALDEAEAAAASYRASDDDEDGGGARKKLRLTKDQSALLEERFKEHSTLNPKQKQALAKQLSLRPRQVEVWFQNRRARTKLKQNEVDCEFLKRCCETLTDENRRLQKEVQELRALKFAPPPPLYMQLPAATLTMCPSCERIGGASEGAKGAAAGGPFVLSAKPRFFSSFNHPAAC